jgi:hypothetical protein
LIGIEALCDAFLGTLVERKLIANELSDKMPLLLEMLNNEMDCAKDTFEQQEVIEILRNCPSVRGAVVPATLRPECARPARP